MLGPATPRGTAPASTATPPPAARSFARAPIGVAHKKLPCGTKVTFAYEGRWVRAKVIDRGPYIAGRKWDLTYQTRAAARHDRRRHRDGEGDRRAVTLPPQERALALLLAAALASLAPIRRHAPASRIRLARPDDGQQGQGRPGPAALADHPRPHGPDRRLLRHDHQAEREEARAQAGAWKVDGKVDRKDAMRITTLVSKRSTKVPVGVLPRRPHARRPRPSPSAARAP